MDTERFQESWANRLRARGLTTQTSFRLPVSLAVQVDAICDLYPNVSRTAIVADFLTEAIKDFEKKLPTESSSIRGAVQPRAGGLKEQFRLLANAKYKEQLGSQYFEPLYPPTPDLRDSH